MHLNLFVLSLLLVFSGCQYFKRRTDLSSMQNLSAGKVYVVNSGDTIHGIAEKNHVSVLDLMESNGLENSSNLEKGQRLYVPEAEISLAKSQESQKPSYKKEPVDDGKRIDLLWPIKKAVLIQGFDESPRHIHEGISLAAPRGTPVLAAADGEVIYVGHDEARYGKIVIVKHEDPFVTIYTHLAHMDVFKGNHLKQGMVIGTVGDTGGIKSPQLYFQVRKNRTPVDPEKYLIKN